MYSRVRTLGLVCSFWVCAFNIFLLNEFFLFCFFEFIISLFRLFSVSSFFFLPNKIIAIAAVQPASHGFFSVAACCTNQGCSYIFTFCMTKKNNFVNKMLTFCAFLSPCLHFPNVAFGLICSKFTKSAATERAQPTFLAVFFLSYFPCLIQSLKITIYLSAVLVV